MSELKPSVAQMIQVGYGCGLSTLEEAYNQYLSHYDCFFLIDKFNEQHAEFVKELKDLGFTEQVDGFYQLIDMNLEACFKILGITPTEYEEPEYKENEECQLCPLDELSVPLSATELQVK